MLKRWKNVVVAVLVGCCVLVGMTGCMNAEPERFALGEAGELKDFSLLVLSYEMMEQVETSEILSYQPTVEGNLYLKVKMTAKNIGEEPLSLLPLEYHTQTDLTLAIGMSPAEEGQAVSGNDGGATTVFESVNLMGYQEGLADKLLAPGEEITGYVFFEVPATLEAGGTDFWMEATLGRTTLLFALSDEMTQQDA